jgi:hypothetical protein
MLSLIARLVGGVTLAVVLGVVVLAALPVAVGYVAASRLRGNRHERLMRRTG